MSNEFQLHIEFPHDGECHAAPYAVVDGYVKGVRNLTGLVALAICREGSIEGVNSVNEAQRMFEFMVSSPERGSVILPLGLREQVDKVRVSASVILSNLFIVLSAIASGQDEGLKLLNRLNDDERASFVAEIARLSPADSSQIVSLDFTDGKISFSSAMTLTATAKLKNYEIAPDEDIKSLIGEFVAVDTLSLVITIRSLETGELVSCRYFPEAFDGSVLTPNSLIQLFGKFEEDAEGAITSMSDVNSIVGVDLSPLSVMFRGKEVKMAVELDKDSGQYYWASHPDLGIEVFAETRSALSLEVRDALGANWEQLALREDSELDESALPIKRALLAFA